MRRRRSLGEKDCHSQSIKRERNILFSRQKYFQNAISQNAKLKKNNLERISLPEGSVKVKMFFLLLNL